MLDEKAESSDIAQVTSAKKKTDSVEGSFFIRVKPSGNWFVYHQTYQDGKKVQKALPEKSYEALGFERHWPVIKAKAYVQ